MALSLNQISFEEKTKTESEYENAGFDRNVVNNCLEQEDYYEELKPSPDVSKPEVQRKAQPNEYTKWQSDNNSVYANQETINQVSNIDDNGINLLFSPPQKQPSNCCWQIAAITCAVLFLGTGSAFVAVTLQSRSSVTPCNVMDCENMGTCFVDENLQAKCACRSGFYGKNCSYTPCYSDPCLHGGSCSFIFNESRPICACRTGFYGNVCEKTPCTNSPCEHNGVCNIDNSGFKCTCVDGYSGLRCKDFKCSAEPENYQSCILQQDLFEGGNWLRSQGSVPGSSYFYVTNNGVVRYISRPISIDVQKCVSFSHQIYKTNSTQSSGYMVLREDTYSRWLESAGPFTGWKSLTYKLTRSTNKEIQVVFEAHRKNTYNVIRIKNVTIHDC